MAHLRQTEEQIALLEKYRAGTCTPEEIKQVDEWFEAFEGEVVPQLLKRRSVKEVNKTIRQTIASGQKRKTIKMPWLQIAAMLTILLSSAIFVYHYFRHTEPSPIKYTSISTKPGERKTVVLPDGSKVSLNSASSISFADKFDENTRSVSMLGEAFFDVQHEQKRSFIVHTGTLNVQVLGTSFNVKSFGEESQVKVTVSTGKVGVYKKGMTTAMLLPGDQLSFNKATNKVATQKVEASEYSAWQGGILFFKDETLEEIGRRLERWYDVKFVFKSQSLKKEQFNLKQTNESLANVLKSLSMAGDGFRYHIKNKEVVIW